VSRHGVKPLLDDVSIACARKLSQRPSARLNDI